MEKMENSTRKRYGYVDFIRVFSVCMVVVLHCICDYYNETENCSKSLWLILGFVNELCRTGVPLFFMISGFLLLDGKITSIKEFYKRRFLKVCIPFILYDIFYYVVTNLRNHSRMSVAVFLKELFTSGSAGHLWFIYSILFIYLLIPFIKMIVDRCDLKALLLFFTISIFQTTIRAFINTVGAGYVYIYLADEGITGYLGYMILGYILGKYKFKPVTEAIIYVLGIAALIIFPIFSMNSVRNGTGYLFHGGYSLNHYIEAAAIFVLAKNLIHGSNKCMAKLSVWAMDIYFIHMFIINELKCITWKYVPSVLIIIFTVITLTLSVLWALAKDAVKERFRKTRPNRKLKHTP